MKRILKKILLSIPVFQSLCRLLTRRHVRTLMYHRFSAHERSDSRFVSLECLEEQLAYIRRYHATWTPDKHFSVMQENAPWQRCPVVLTIDDGYRDFYEVAYPVFKRCSIAPMLFVTTNFVEHGNMLWWDKLRLMLEETTQNLIDIELGGVHYTLSLRSDEDQNEAWNLIADHCRFMSQENKNRLLDKLADRLGFDKSTAVPSSFSACTWQEIKQMYSTGILFGAHTLNHPILSRLSRDDAYAEITGSKKMLEENLGCQIDWFCYPQGGPADFTEETKLLIAQSGFKGCYVAYQALEYDGLSLPRYCITEDMLDFTWCMCGAEYLVLSLRKALGRPASLGDYYWRGSESKTDKSLVSGGK